MNPVYSRIHRPGRLVGPANGNYWRVRRGQPISMPILTGPSGESYTRATCTNRNRTLTTPSDSPSDSPAT